MVWKKILVACLVVSVIGAIGVGVWYAIDKRRVQTQQSKLINTTQGVVRGYQDDDSGVYAFYNIPYATAPSGVHRFKAPLAPPVWTDTFEAVDRHIVCPQPYASHLNMQEDCLVANIFVPDTEETNLPVIVYIHGGAFVMGRGNQYTPRYFVKDKKIIVINFNYRLGAHGFLCLGTEDAPGNAGMKDQVALLRWVKQNIGNFGGNANDVTLVGFSAGAMLADLLMLSRVTDDLFTKLITESGSSLGALAVQNDPIEKAKQFAKRKGFLNVDDFYALEDFYKNSPWEELFENFEYPADGTSVFSVCVERNTGEEIILHDAPSNIIESGNFTKRPLLYGLTNAEGLFVVPNFDIFRVQMNENFSSFLPGNLIFASDTEKNEVARNVKEFYFQDKLVGPDTISSFVDFFTDAYFANSLAQSVKLLINAGHSEIYLYEYSYVNSELPLNPQSPYITEQLGANHCDQTYAIHDGYSYTNSPTLPEDFVHWKTVLRDLWYNFAVSKKPVPEGSTMPSWPTTGPTCSPYMSLNGSLELRGTLFQDRMAFWADIYDKYYIAPPVTPTPPTIPAGRKLI